MIPFIAVAQNVDINNFTTRQLKKLGENSERVGDAASAIFFYENYRNVKKGNVKLNYRLANLYRETRRYEKAKELYGSFKGKSSKKYPLTKFYLGQMQKSTGEYSEAIESFTDFRRNIRNNNDLKPYNKLARLEISGCDSAKKILETPVKVTIDYINTEVNGPHMEFSPIPINDSTLVYAALKVDSLIYFSDDNFEESMPVRKFYIAKKEELDWIPDGEWNTPFNLEGVETGNGAFSKDGNRFYFTRCAKNWQNKTICAIYVSHKVDNKWQEPIKLPEEINNTDYTSTQPTVAVSAKRGREIIYFVSDNPEGKGGLDIWYTIWDSRKNIYKKPSNLGNKINTAADEMTPYYDNFSRVLFFSSSGLPGIGGLDIFSAFGEMRKWYEIKNVGYPLNSSYDDLYCILTKNGESGFFTSNRPGGKSFTGDACCDDIYYFKWDEYIKPSVTGKIYPIPIDRFGRKNKYANIDFYQPPDSIKPYQGAIIALYMIDEKKDIEIFMDRDTTDVNGKYFFDLLPNKDYKFEMEGSEYFKDKIQLSTDFFVSSDTVEMPPIWVNVMTDAPIVLENVYYEFNAYDLPEPSKRAIDTTLLLLLKEAPNFIIEISSHTDNVGGDKYNKDLSQKRAENVVKYLIEKGINEKRLIARGYGSEKPVAPNTNEDGSDNPEGRMKNRRTEFRVAGSLLTEGDDDEGDEEW